MTEVLFILTTIYVAYVVYTIADEQKSAATPTIKAEMPKQAATEEPVKAAVTATPATPIAQAKPVKDKAKPTATIKPTIAKASVRNPKTGEVSGVAANYRFAKRWIKEALVAEGLLDRIYKNNELDAPAEAAIKKALTALAALEKYRA
jgi:hypothetical protein